MAERSFKDEVQQLRLGAGQTFTGEGILAITKALLENGVGYVGGYQGAPISHLMDVLADAEDLMAELGIRFEANASEAAAAAMLAASVHYPIRGAVTFKGSVGVNVASDALANLSSSGVKGGALVIVGEDYGEGSSIMQERSHPFAMKSQFWLMDPRPNLPSIVKAVGDGFELSEASNTPVMLMVRIRSCHVTGSFETRDNRPPPLTVREAVANPQRDFARVVLPPMSYVHEQEKVKVRWPAAEAFIADRGLNERFGPARGRVGIVLQGGMYNGVIRALQRLGLADLYGDSRVPLYVLNVTYPLLSSEFLAFAEGKDAVLVVEEGQPEFIEQEILATLRRRDVQTPVHGKDLLPAAGEYTVEVIAGGLEKFLSRHLPELALDAGRAWLQGNAARRQRVSDALSSPLPPRPPQFCVGCPERPVFSALKLAQREVGPVHIAADIGCHAFATFEPFSFGHSILGYGMSLASRAGVSPMMERRALAIMGDGGFWHNGLLTGVQSALFNGDDAVLLIMKNGYTSATGTQEIISTPAASAKLDAEDKQASLVHRDQTIEQTLAGMGVKWLRTVHTYRVAEMKRTLEEAFTTDFAGLKVIVAEGECQLERQRRIRPWIAGLLKAGKRVVRVKYGVDEDVCSGDHACIRLSGCPTLTLKDSPDSLRVDPVATVIDGCVGCGLCGENAHAATLCPSFYRAEIVRNPKWHERLVDGLRAAVIRMLQPA